MLPVTEPVQGLRIHVGIVIKHALVAREGARDI